MTFKEIQDRIISYGWGEDDRARIKVWVNDCYQDIASRQRWSWTRTTASVTTTANTPTNTLATNPQFWGRLRPFTPAVRVPEFVGVDAPDSPFLDAQGERTAAMPEVYTVVGSTIRWFPTPDVAYGYAAEYWAAPPVLTADGDTPLLDSADHLVLVMGGAMHAAVRDQNGPFINHFSGQYEGMIAKMKANEGMAFTGGVTKIPMPGNYRGIYG